MEYLDRGGAAIICNHVISKAALYKVPIAHIQETEWLINIVVYNKQAAWFGLTLHYCPSLISRAAMFPTNMAIHLVYVRGQQQTFFIV